MDINTLNTLGAVGAVIISVIGYVISYFKTKNNIAKAKEKEAVTIALEKQELQNTIKGIKDDIIEIQKTVNSYNESNLATNKELKQTLDNLNCTLQGISNQLIAHSKDIEYLKEDK